ncbi:MAG: hypothetical protein ACLGIO_00070 [Acidimicrobiia bacterium]
MDLVAELDEMTYRLIACAADDDEARRRVAVVAHWAAQQAERLGSGRPVRVDHDRMIDEALATPISAVPTG